MPATLSTSPRAHYGITAVEAGWEGGRGGWVRVAAGEGRESSARVGPRRRGAARGGRVVAPPPTPAPSLRPPARYARARLARGFSEIERKSFELDREVDVLEANVARNFDTGGCEVQNGLDPRRGQLVGDRLRRLRGHRDDRDLDPARLHLTPEVAAGEDRRRFDLVHDLRRILVEDGRDAKSLTGEPAIVEQRRAEVAVADERHGPLAIETEDALELGLQPRDVVPDAAYAELAEVGEVFSDLRRVEIEPIRQLLRGHGLHAVLFELQQTSGVDRETTDRHLGDLREASVRPWHHRAARRARGACGAPALRYTVDVMRN